MKLYSIVRYRESSGWSLLGPDFYLMGKSYAQGAFAMIKAHYGSGSKFRLVSREGDKTEIIDEWDSPEVYVTQKEAT